MNPLYRWEDEERRRGTGSAARGHTAGECPSPAATQVPPTSKLSGPCASPTRTTFRCGARTPAGRPGLSPSEPGRQPCPGGAGPCFPPGSAVPRPGGSLPTPRAPRLSGRGTYSASPRSSSPQPAKWPAGTHLQEGETEAQRGPATSPRSHSAAARSPAGGRGLGAPSQPAGGPAVSPRDTHSRSCPRAPAPPRTPSGQRPWCLRRGPRGARPSQAPGWRRLRSGRSGLGSSAGRDAGDGSEPRVPRGARARPLIAAEGGAPRS